MNAYEELQDEFNRRQLVGEDCGELVTLMVAALSERLIPECGPTENQPRPRLVHSQEGPSDE